MAALKKPIGVAGGDRADATSSRCSSHTWHGSGDSLSSSRLGRKRLSRARATKKGPASHQKGQNHALQSHMSSFRDN